MNLKLVAGFNEFISEPYRQTLAAVHSKVKDKISVVYNILTEKEPLFEVSKMGKRLMSSMNDINLKKIVVGISFERRKK